MGVAGVNNSLKCRGNKNINSLRKNAITILNKLTALVSLRKQVGKKKRKEKKIN
jgi:hypothetical protein